MPKKLTKQQVFELYPSLARGAATDDFVHFNKSDPPLLFADILLRDQPLADDNIQRTNTEDDDKKVSVKIKELVAEMIRAAPSLHPQTAARWLLHSEQGQKLLAQHKRNTPMIDIAKVIAVTEDCLMVRAKLQKRDGETDAHAFTRLYEGDIEFRRQWASVSEAKQLLGLAATKAYPNLASLTPTSTEVGGTLVSDDSAEAIRLLNEMAEKQHRTFEQVFADPNNKALAGKTYTGAHRPTASSTSGSELQN
jgi:hypothetical protein